MLVKLIAVTIMAGCLVTPAKTAGIKNLDTNVAAVFVKDSNTGELRFLRNGFANAQINQLITNKQNFWELFRPGADVITQTGNGNTAVDNFPDTNIDTNTNTGPGATFTAGEGATATGTGATADTIARPLVINANRVNSNRRRKPNRRPGNKRRPGSKRPQIIIIRRRP